jgi:ketosteroid isomerase-like protein
MSQENVEIVRRLVAMGQEGIQSGDLARALDEAVASGLISPTCEWRAGPRGGSAVVGIGDEVGPEGIVEFIRTWTEDFSDFTVEVEDVIDAHENQVVVIQRQRGTGKASGAPVNLRTAYIFRVEARQVVRIGVFLDPTKALEAAGLSE